MENFLETLDKFSMGQIYEIKAGIENGVNVAKYANPKYDKYQMNELRHGLENGEDISLYNNPELSGLQIEIIRNGIKFGADVTKFNKPEFSSDQMKTICGASIDGLSIVERIADPSIPYEEMIRMINEETDF